MTLLLTAVALIAAIALGVAWFATKGHDDHDDDNDSHTEGW